MCIEEPWDEPIRSFDPKIHVLNVDRVPDWFQSGDLIINRRGRTFVRSLTQTEPRWKSWLGRVRRLLKRKISR